jgi:hypothetical protein
MLAPTCQKLQVDLSETVATNVTSGFFDAAVAVMTLLAPALTMAPGVGVEVPGVGGVRIGEPDRYREDRDYDRRRYRERREYREREGSYGRGCKTITIQRDDGSVKRIRRCDGD